ncbi:Response regulator receiver [Polaromonas sp. CG9_12]|nr:Response regulator receiver [Polaromonas sp. CG9_12]
MFLVEDSAAQCAYVTQILTAEAKVVIVGVAATEPLAVEWLDRHPDQWDIALVDLYLSEGTGVGVIRHCQNRRPGQSILVMTNHARNDHLLHHCERLGVDAVYHKATELESLVTYCKSMAARMPQCAA